jgi:adenosylhomocysteine nucleosidase
VTGRVARGAVRVDVAAFAALGWETRAVLRGLADVRPAPAPRQWYGRLGDGASCLLTQTAMGTERAAAAAAAVPEASFFLSLGCGGGLVPWLRTGDLVVATEVICLDQACRPAARVPARVPGAAVDGERGPIASSPRVLATSAQKIAASGSGALLVDMESWALAAEAARRDVPFAAVRVVLDGALDELPFLGAAIDPESGDLDAWRAARALLPRPWSWPAMLRMARQQREAERRLGEAIAALARGGPSTTWQDPGHLLARDRSR